MQYQWQESEGRIIAPPACSTQNWAVTCHEEKWCETQNRKLLRAKGPSLSYWTGCAWSPQGWDQEAPWPEQTQRHCFLGIPTVTRYRADTTAHKKQTANATKHFLQKTIGILLSPIESTMKRDHTAKRFMY